MDQTRQEQCGFYHLYEHWVVYMKYADNSVGIN